MFESAAAWTPRLASVAGDFTWVLVDDEHHRVSILCKTDTSFTSQTSGRQTVREPGPSHRSDATTKTARPSSSLNQTDIERPGRRRPSAAGRRGIADSADGPLDTAVIAGWLTWVAPDATGCAGRERRRSLQRRLTRPVSSAGLRCTPEVAESATPNQQTTRNRRGHRGSVEPLHTRRTPQIVTTCAEKRALQGR